MKEINNHGISYSGNTKNYQINTNINMDNIKLISSNLIVYIVASSEVVDVKI